MKTYSSLLSVIAAVLLWSLTPVLSTAASSLIVDNDLFLGSLIVALIASGIVFLAYPQRTKEFFHDVQAHRNIVFHLGMTGILLGFWYFGYYKGMNEAPKPDVTIVAFTWPLIAVVTMSIVKHTKLTMIEWGCMVLAFVGAAYVALSEHNTSNYPHYWSGIVWAVIAAFGSGLYLPFLSQAMSTMPSLKAPAWKTCYSISIANVFSLATAIILSLITRSPMLHSTVEPKTLAIWLTLGIGIYLVAEIAWVWGFNAHSSPTIASFPYFVPSLSILALVLFYTTHIRYQTWIGLALVLCANLVLHVRKNHTEELEEIIV